MLNRFFFLILISIIPLTHSIADPSVLDMNKKVVTSFYNKAFNLHDPKGAISQFVGEKYIQHNPFVKDGKQPFIDFFLEFHKKNPEAHIAIKRIIAEGDLVVVHVHSKINSNDLGNAVMDIFRLEDGKIIEHWDVGQPVPEKSANNNTMF